MIEIVGSDFTNHWREGQPEDEYHADSTAIGSGRLKTILKSPATFMNMMTKPPVGPTEAFRFGRLVHLAILEPAKFRERVIVAPDFGDQRSSVNRNSKETWYKNVHPLNVVCDPEDHETLKGMMTALLNHEHAFRLLKDGKTEISGYYRDPETGIKCRIRPDFLGFKLNVLVDLKTTRDCEMEEFSRACWQYRYDFQLAMYAEGVKQITGKAPDYAIIIALEKTPPYEIAVYTADEAMMERGMIDYRKALRLLKTCLDEKKWPGYQSAVQSITLPPWAFWSE